MNTIPIKFVIRERTGSESQGFGKSKENLWREFCDVIFCDNEKCSNDSHHSDEYNRICLLFADIIAKILQDKLKQNHESKKSTKKLKLLNHNSVLQHRKRVVKNINTFKLSFVNKNHLCNCYCKR